MTKNDRGTVTETPAAVSAAPRAGRKLTSVAAHSARPPPQESESWQSGAVTVALFFCLNFLFRSIVERNRFEFSSPRRVQRYLAHAWGPSRSRTSAGPQYRSMAAPAGVLWRGPSAVLLGPARAVRVQAAATRRERTRRPNFRCMIGPYDPAGRCAAGWVTVPGLRPRISSRQVRDPYTRGRQNAQKSHYGRFEQPGTRGLLHAARGCPCGPEFQICYRQVAGDSNYPRFKF